MTDRTTIVGIGASAGGIGAFGDFFRALPPDTGMAFVVVLHLSPDRPSLLPDIIAHLTEMPVAIVADGAVPKPNQVLVPPPGRVVELRDGRLRLRPPEAPGAREYKPIDIFFDSLAREMQEDAIAIVLSGTGSDGTLGLRVVKAHGGLTMAQGGLDGHAEFPGMPESAIATGAVDLALPPGEMPARLLGAHVIAVPAPSRQADELREAICEALRGHLGHDFAHYKERTFLRRVRRRMQVVGTADMADYLQVLRGSASEARLLFRDLLISVTSFFRDPDAFAALEACAVPLLLAGRGGGDSLRVWVPGCATGEEAYTLAMILREHADRMDDPPRIQVFATDLDEAAIATARAGRYTESLLEGVPEARRRRFFNASEGGYVVARELRDLCTFSVHSLTRDPPFSRIDLLSCRNLLIYLDAEMQDVVIPAFHYALNPGGVLLLGSSESATRRGELFEALDETQRIYRRIDGASPAFALSGRPGVRMPDTPAAPSQSREPAMNRNRAVEDAHARMLQQFAPPFVVVTANGDIVHFSARTGAYLEAPQGGPSRNVIDQARRGLALELRAVLRALGQGDRRVERPFVTFLAEGDLSRSVSIVGEALRDTGASRLFMLVFVEGDRRGAVAGAPGVVAEAAPLGADQEEAESELRHTREQLRSVMEDHETALEELRSANEELNSLNEEMQSTNEELETSKEEIQSVNEELQTVNHQLSAKVEELDRTNSDIRNLFESTQVATIFLDPHLVLRGFTPAIGEIYSLIPSDHGRPLTDIASRLRYDTLREDVAQVLRSLRPLERRVVRADGGAHYLMRILPYRGPDSRVDGTLITFVDVTSIVQAEQHQRLLVDELNHRVKNMLTVVISLAAQTLRRATSLEEFSASFLGRVESLTAAYALLSRENWSSVSLRDVLQEGLKPYMNHDQTNIALTGPAVLMEPRGALALGMAVHELATNAVKYGSLSAPGGQVAIAWSLAPADDGQRLELAWQEAGGPAVASPGQRGFGMTLIERSLPHDLNGDARLEFRPEGLHAVLHAALPARAAASLPGAADRAVPVADVPAGGAA